MRSFQKDIKTVLKLSGKTESDTLNRAARNAIIGPQGAIKKTPRASLAKIKATEAFNTRRMAERGMTAEQIKRALAQKRSARGYTAGPGWHKAARAFGGRGVKTQGRYSKSRAAKSTSKKSTIARLVALLENSAPAAHKIGKQALQNGLNAAARDMVTYWNNRIQKNFEMKR